MALDIIPKIVLKYSLRLFILFVILRNKVHLYVITSDFTPQAYSLRHGR